jgi:3-demethoxyubiquinol 3-hydroxylase
MGGNNSGTAYQNIPVDPRDALTIARIVKVNHAGEFGAIRIYSAQLMVSRWFWPDCHPALSEMLRHERNHCAIFRAAMPFRKSRPCRVMQFWSYGGWLLGFLTACLGRNGIWACTAAVEAAVHRHLDDQLHFLQNRDAELYRSFSRSGQRNWRTCITRKSSFVPARRPRFCARPFLQRRMH